MIEIYQRLWIPRAEAETMVDKRVNLDLYYALPLTKARIQEAERNLGVKLPPSLLDFLRFQNGGFLRTHEFDHGDLYIDFRSVNGLGTPSGLDGPRGSLYMQREWGYPEGTLYLDGDGHTGVFLDYRTPFAGTEPPVVHIESEDGEPVISPLAPNFGEFLRILDREGRKGIL